LGKDGKASLYGADGSPKPDVKKFLDAGATVVGVDLLYQGEFLAEAQPFTKTPRVKNPRETAPYTFGYNHAVFAQRVHDVLTAVKFIKTYERPSKRIQLACLDEAAPVAAAAAGMCGDAIDTLAIDTHGFRFGKVLDLHDPNFLPGGAKYGDLLGMLALGSVKTPWLAGEAGTSEKDLSTLRAATKPFSGFRTIVVDAATGEQTAKAAVDHLLRSVE
jgi:hypothetical protein